MPGHGAMDRGWSSSVGRLLNGVGGGVLACHVPPSLVDEALAVTGRAQRRFTSRPLSGEVATLRSGPGGGCKEELLFSRASRPLHHRCPVSPPRRYPAVPQLGRILLVAWLPDVVCRGVSCRAVAPAVALVVAAQLRPPGLQQTAQDHLTATIV